MILKILEMNEIDVDAHARLIYESRQNSPLRNNERTVDGIKEAFAPLIEQKEKHVMIIAKDENSGELLGQLMIWLDWGEMAVTRPWQPIIHPSTNQEEVAIALIEHSKVLIKPHTKTRLESWLEPRSKQEVKMAAIYEPWFQSSGFDLVAKEYFMDSKYSELAALDNSIPTGIEVLSISDVSADILKNTVLETFRNSSDRWFLTMTQGQQESSTDAWLKMDKSFDQEASIAFVEEDRIIGYNVMRVEDDSVEVGPIGVVSSRRGHGLGSTLLLTSIERLSPRSPQTVWLTVSTENLPAYHLYSKLGFVNRYQILIYAWMP
jgi:ribosomal protein S18 acetylase RimI-like enzyme